MRLGVILVVIAAATAAVALSSATASSKKVTAITPAPAWSADQLAANPSTDWISTGGSLANQRYSLLNQVSTTNVAGLTQAWMTHFDGSGSASKYSQEDSPLEYNGVLYVVTGNDDVFAIDATTGAHLWTYQSNNEPEEHDGVLRLGCPRRRARWRQVYVAQLDGDLVALDQTTGQVDWKTQNVRWEDGQTMTMSPTLLQRHGVRRRVGWRVRRPRERDGLRRQHRPARLAVLHRPDAGRSRLRHVAGQQRVGPRRCDDLEQPVHRPGHDQLIFTTGNADLWSGRGPGKDLFNDSFVSVNASTGQYNWHYQVVHHDIWDYDCPSPTVQFQVTIGGVQKNAVAEPSRPAGSTHRPRTGQPFIPGNIEEQKVPQNAFQHTSPTQPYVRSKPFVLAVRSPAGLQGHGSPTGTPYKVGCIFTPYDRRRFTAVAPDALGGNNWPPMSFNPQTQSLYTCETKTDMALGAIPPALKKPYVGGQGYTNVGFGKLVSFGGTVTAVDATTNQIKWQISNTDPAQTCYGGTTSTAGGLVLYGTLDGYFHAVDAATGKELWKSPKLAYGADAPPVTYSVNGKQYIAIVAGGSVLGSAKGAAPHGDGVYVFALPSS